MSEIQIAHELLDMCEQVHAFTLEMERWTVFPATTKRDLMLVAAALELREARHRLRNAAMYFTSAEEEIERNG